MKKLNKKFVLILSIVLMVAFSITGCGGQATDESVNDTEEDQQVYEMKLAHLTTKENPLNVGYEYLADLLKEKTDGRIIMNIYGNGQISTSDREQAEMVQNDMIQMCTTPSYVLAGINSELTSFNIYDVPYLFLSDSEIHSFSDSEVGEKMLTDLLDKTGIKGYGAFPIGWVKVSSNAKPINSPADLEGLNIRTTKSKFYVNTMKAWGANPTPIAYGEVFTALQQGTVDGMMTACSLYVTDRFYEVQKYMGAVNPFAITHYPVISNTWYESLPEDLQQTFDECMLEYVDFMRELETQAEADSIEALRDKGMEVTEYTPEQLQTFIDPVKPMWDENADIVGGAEFLQEVKDYLGR